MPNFRHLRISEDVKRELCDIFRSLKDPRIDELISIIKLDLANDLSYAKVYISSPGGLEMTKNSVKGLVSAKGYIKRELGLRLDLRRIPELKFIPDNSIEHSEKIFKIMKDFEYNGDKNEN